MQRIKTNKVKCLFCGDIIESIDVHDYKTCKCGKISVDGGHYYLKRMIPSGYKPEECIEDLSEYEDDNSK